jgi:hypothetical protein
VVFREYQTFFAHFIFLIYSRAEAGCAAEEESDDDSFVVGPRPPAPGETLSMAELNARDIEQRANRMRDKIEGRDKQVQTVQKLISWGQASTNLIIKIDHT